MLLVCEPHTQEQGFEKTSWKHGKILQSTEYPQDTPQVMSEEPLLQHLEPCNIPGACLCGPYHVCCDLVTLQGQLEPKHHDPWSSKA